MLRKASWRIGYTVNCVTSGRSFNLYLYFPNSYSISHSFNSTWLLPSESLPYKPLLGSLLGLVKEWSSNSLVWYQRHSPWNVLLPHLCLSEYYPSFCFCWKSIFYMNHCLPQLEVFIFLMNYIRILSLPHVLFLQVDYKLLEGRNDLILCYL